MESGLELRQHASSQEDIKPEKKLSRTTAADHPELAFGPKAR
jgi:hypothetical protein